MKLEDQVAPLALAQRMKELGFAQDTLFVWMGSRTVDSCAVVPNPALRNEWAWNAVHTADSTMARVAAPTVAEIGEALPAKIQTWDSMVMWRKGGRHKIEYGDGVETGVLLNPNVLLMKADGATEAEARARLWIALAEAGAIPLAPHPPRG